MYTALLPVAPAFHPGGAFPRADVDGGVRGVLRNGMGPDGIAVV